MRLYALILFGAILLIPNYSRAQNFSDPVVYNDYLIKEQTHIIGKSLEYLAFSIQSDNYDAIDKRRLEFLDEIRRSMNKIRRLPSYQGTFRLKKETLDVFEQYLTMYETDLIEMMGLKKQYSDSYAALEAYLKAEKDMDDKLRKSIESLTKAQEAFAKKYDLKMEEFEAEDLEANIESVSELSGYSRSVFLVYFKVSWEFNEMVKLLPEQHGKKIEKQRIQVIEACNKGLMDLKNIKPIDDETEYMSLTVDLIQYFKSLSRKEFSLIAQIFEKDSMTQKDADYVNKVIADYNANIRNLVLNWNLANQYMWKENVN